MGNFKVYTIFNKSLHQTAPSAHCKKGFVILTIVFLTRIATVDMVYGMILE